MRNEEEGFLHGRNDEAGHGCRETRFEFINYKHTTEMMCVTE